MSHPLEDLRTDALREISAASDENALEAARVRYLGRNGTISAWGEQMKTLGKEEKPIVGKLLNEVRNAVTSALEQASEKFRAQKNRTRSLTSTSRCRARRANAARCIPSPRCSNAAFKFFGAWASRWPMAPTSKMNGIASTRSTRRPIIPRATSRTHFICPDGRLLRTHTSTVQIRTMQSAAPPIRVIAPGAAVSPR